MSTDNILEIQGLSKHYGKLRALDNLNLQVRRGSVFGLLGPNGSGKTTTLGMILDVINPSSGTYRWFNAAPSHDARKRIGAILEKPNFYPKLSAYHNLRLVCKIKEVEPSRIDKVIAQVGLSGREHDNFKTYSLGMKQRLSIASALLANPEVLVLDEPTNGLDPQGIAEIRELIVQIAEEGKTIILASHLLDEVQKVCQDFAVLRSGKLIHQGRVDANSGNERVYEIGAADLTSLREALVNLPGKVSVKSDGPHVQLVCQKEVDGAYISKYLAEQGLYLSHLHEQKKNLEQKFIEILSEND